MQVEKKPLDNAGTGSESALTSLDLLYHVSREFAAALDLRTVLQRVLLLSMKNVGAINGSIIVLDENGQPVESALLVRGLKRDLNTAQLRDTFDHGLAGWVARSQQPALVEDTSRDERWLRRPDDSEERSGAKSAVSSPILTRERVVGVMTLVHPQPGFFKAEHLDLVQAIADQAGIAILNARLYAESQRQARVMTAVAESSAVITASLNLDEVLQRILEQISQALRVEVVSLALLDPQERELEYRASIGSPIPMAGLRLPLGHGIAGWVAKEGRGTVVPDVSLDPRYDSTLEKNLGFCTRSVVCAPIRSSGQVIGILEGINPQDGQFNSDALLVLTGIGSLAGTAIQHAQLFESLQLAHQRYRELFEDSIDPILVTDWQGLILEANRKAEEMTGRSKDALRSLTIGDLHPLDQEKLGEQFEKLASGETVSYESELNSLSSGPVPVQVHVRQVLIDGRSQLQWIVRDITERKNLDSLRNDLVSMIYHDLRSPLANIVSSLDVLDSMLSQENDPAFRSLLNIAVRSTERIQRLTNSLLDIERLEAGQPLLDSQAVAPLQVATEAVDMVSQIAQNKNLVVEIDIDAGLPPVQIDADMIRRVIVNLFENAIKFTPPGSKIKLGASLEGSFVQMWVTDSGPGIPPAERERIFDKFTRLNTKQGPRGLGLGLAFCRLAVVGHGGKIWVESEPGSGSSFNFLLPVATGTTSADTETD